MNSKSAVSKANELIDMLAMEISGAGSREAPASADRGKQLIKEYAEECILTMAFFSCVTVTNEKEYLIDETLPGEPPALLSEERKYMKDYVISFLKSGNIFNWLTQHEAAYEADRHEKMLSRMTTHAFHSYCESSEHISSSYQAFLAEYMNETSSHTPRSEWNKAIFYGAIAHIYMRLMAWSHALSNEKTKKRRELVALAESLNSIASRIKGTRLDKGAYESHIDDFYGDIYADHFSGRTVNPFPLRASSETLSNIHHIAESILNAIIDKEIMHKNDVDVSIKLGSKEVVRQLYMMTLGLVTSRHKFNINLSDIENSLSKGHSIAFELTKTIDHDGVNSSAIANCTSELAIAISEKLSMNIHAPDFMDLN